MQDPFITGSPNPTTQEKPQDPTTDPVEPRLTTDQTKADIFQEYLQAETDAGIMQLFDERFGFLLKNPEQRGYLATVAFEVRRRFDLLVQENKRLTVENARLSK